MGLDKAKSLLPVTGGNTFLDLIAKQVGFMKEQYKMPDMTFMVMNSFATSADTLEAFSKYPHLGKGDDLEFVQNKAPKVTASDNSAATWPALKCPTYWVGRLCKNNSHTRKYRINVKCEMRNKCVSLGNATYIQHTCKINTYRKIPSRRRFAAAGWDLHKMY